MTLYLYNESTILRYPIDFSSSNPFVVHFPPFVVSATGVPLAGTGTDGHETRVIWITSSENDAIYKGNLDNGPETAKQTINTS